MKTILIILWMIGFMSMASHQDKWWRDHPDDQNFGVFVEGLIVCTIWPIILVSNIGDIMYAKHN